MPNNVSKFIETWKALDLAEHDSYQLEYLDNPKEMISALAEDNLTLFNQILAVLQEEGVTVKPTTNWAKSEFTNQKVLRQQVAKEAAMNFFKRVSGRDYKGTN